jgi:hypothetical protein
MNEKWRKYDILTLNVLENGDLVNSLAQSQKQVICSSCSYTKTEADDASCRMDLHSDLVQNDRIKQAQIVQLG